MKSINSFELEVSDYVQCIQNEITFLPFILFVLADMSPEKSTMRITKD